MPEERSESLQFDSVYLDTNILYGEGWPCISAKLENMLALAKSVGVAVYLPEAVERELEGRWLRAFGEKLERLREQIEPLQRLLSRLPAAGKPTFGLPTTTEVQSSYKDSVDQVKKAWSIRTAPIPELGTGKLLDLAINRAVAFEDKGKNFQDTVIYLSVIEHMKQSVGGHSVFISADGIFGARQTDLEKLATDKGVDLRICGRFDDVADALVSKKAKHERNLIENDSRKALSAFQNQVSDLRTWLNAHRGAIKGLRENCPAQDYEIEVSRIESVVPAFGQHKPGDHVAISIDVAVNITGLIMTQVSVINGPIYNAFTPPQPPYATNVESTPAISGLWCGSIEIEAEATFAGDTYMDFSLLAARLKATNTPTTIGALNFTFHSGQLLVVLKSMIRAEIDRRGGVPAEFEIRHHPQGYRVIGSGRDLVVAASEVDNMLAGGAIPSILDFLISGKAS